MPGSTVYPPTEATLITLPPFSRMPQRHALWAQISGPITLTPTVFIARGTSMSIMGPKYGFVAALLTRMSTGPKRATVASTHARAASASPAFASNHATPPPPPSAPPRGPPLPFPPAAAALYSLAPLRHDTHRVAAAIPDFYPAGWSSLARSRGRARRSGSRG